MKLNAFALTDIGLKRKINQDAFLKDDELGLFIVADGMGGHRGGEVASKLAVDVIRKYCFENRGGSGRELLDKGINMSCQEIYQHALQHEELAGMGTTVAALLFTKEGNDDVVYIGQVGDSRAYLMCPDGIWQVTEDHSLLNEEIRSGRLAAGQVASYQFKNVITRSVGYENHVVVDIYRRKLKAKDTYLLCSDGLSSLVGIAEINDELRRNGVENAVKNLVALANSRGGDDNVTVLACEVLE
jgi:PPM family protein phosphatase